MPTAFLTDRALVSVSGPDAEHLLQNVITTDLDALAAGEVKPGALLAPQGKILFDFLISRDGAGGFLLDCRADIADDLARRLSLYRLRAKAEIAKREQPLVQIWWQDDSSPSQSDSTPAEGLRDRRFAEPSAVRRAYPRRQEGDGDLAAWQAFRIASGIAESGVDYALGDAFPHDVLLDQVGGVGLRKGCYVGQEVVSRMQHRGTARRRALIVSALGELPAPGTDILAGGRPIGSLGSTAGASALGIVRIDKVKAAMDAGQPITAGDAVLSLAIPAWATFTFPQGTAAEEA
ncbi:YgfZ/GcvT domain-containing protein [Kumtagia ephedrae]|uniref:Folate-binding protein YgfZ n=1 Tax=Kumtagia ephedrae TaxID=2116701 RepID=A0A2P7RLC3_9HYPH|nr:folate-binding protein YgfZ [Mesorhizobium ephedrae]PSJ51018.1 folate-binding protein YgfZ [Mesorhizobium ephedrae]